MDANMPDTERRPAARGFDGPLWLVLGAGLILRLAYFDQPIVENYVGRQVPTAMVARNFTRSSGPFRPVLDTAPFPNYFLVEPPLYEWGVVGLQCLTGLGLEASGRALSALALVLAGWGVFELLDRAAGRRAALFAVAAFTFFPISVRYGRAFQPDAAMLGATTAGLACWARSETGQRGPSWLAAGWILMALGFALKITAAFLLVPLIFGVFRARRFSRVLAAGATLLPAFAWYVWAAHLVGQGGGSRASADNRTIWLGALGPWALARRETLELVFRFVVVRAFTPLGASLAVVGLCWSWGRDGISGRLGRRFWLLWAIAGSAALACLAKKLHHEHYFLVLAPVAATGAGLALDRLAASGRGGAIKAALAVSALLTLSLVQARSTWRVPPEWENLRAAAGIVDRTVPVEAWVVAPEALLFQADRRGCRLEWTAASARRAAGEWGDAPEVNGPLDLVEHYRRRGARYFADLIGPAAAPRRMALHAAIRRRYKVIVDRPEVLIAELVGTEMGPHAN